MNNFGHTPGPGGSSRDQGPDASQWNVTRSPQQGPPQQFHQGQQPYPQNPQQPQFQGGYGQPPQGYHYTNPYGPPPTKSNKGLIIGLIAAVTLIIAGLITWLVLSGGDDDEARDGDNTSQNRGVGPLGPNNPEGPNTPDGPVGPDQPGKPSREEYRNDLRALLDVTGLTEQDLLEVGLTQSQVDDYLTCIVDNTYDDLSPEAFEGFKSGDISWEPSLADQQVLMEGIQPCRQEISDAIMGGN